MPNGQNSHLVYTIPPAIILTLLYRPLLTRLDVYKILFLIAVSALLRQAEKDPG